MVSLRDLFFDSLSIEDYLVQNLFLSSCDFCYKLCQNFPEANYIIVKNEDLYDNPSIGYLAYDDSSHFQIFEMPALELYENISLFEFLSQKLDSERELMAIIFKKKHYFISLSFTHKGWLLLKNSGKVLFENWAEGCAAAYEMGMAIHLVFYVKKKLSFSQVKNLSEVSDVMRELSQFYQEAPSRLNTN